MISILKSVFGFVLLIFAADLLNAADLTIIVPSGPDGEAVTGAAKDYQGAKGKIVEVVTAPYADLLQKEMSAGSAQEGAYDLLQIDDPWFQILADHKYLERLSGYFQKMGTDGPDNDFVDKSLALCRNPYNVGPYYALPVVGNAQLFFYNKSMLHDAGYDGPMDTWDDVLKGATAVKEKGRGRTFGFVLRGAQGEAVVADFLPIFWSFGAKVFDEAGKPTFDSPAALEALKFFLKLRDVSPPGLTGFDSEEIMNSITQRQSAAAVFWPIFISRFENPDSSRVVGQIAYSAMPSGKIIGRSMIGNWLLGISASSKHKDDAFDFLMFAISRDEMVKAAEQGNSPVRPSVFEDPNLLAKPQFRFFPVLLEALRKSEPRPRQQHWAEISEGVSVELSAALSNKKTPEQALADANKRIAEIIKP
jgi:multiple sugar transport system substrate-binding protein